MLLKEDVDVDTIMAVYKATMDVLVVNGFKRAEVVAGLLSIVVIQTLGHAPDPVRLGQFIKDTTMSISLFFNDPDLKEVTN